MPGLRTGRWRSRQTRIYTLKFETQEQAAVTKWRLAGGPGLGPVRVGLWIKTRSQLVMPLDSLAVKWLFQVSGYGRVTGPGTTSAGPVTEAE